MRLTVYKTRGEKRCEQEQHCGMLVKDNNKISIGQILCFASGNQPRSTTVGRCRLTPGWGSQPARPEHLSQQIWRSCRSVLQAPENPRPVILKLCFIYFWICDTMLKQLELQPKQLMIEKEENGNTLKHGCVILQLCHRIPPQLFRLAERIIQ